MGARDRPSARRIEPVNVIRCGELETCGGEHDRGAGGEALLIHNTLVHGLSNARSEATNTHLRALTKRAYGFHSPDAVIATTLLTRGGLCPPLPAEADPPQRQEIRGRDGVLAGGTGPLGQRSGSARSTRSAPT